MKMLRGNGRKMMTAVSLSREVILRMQDIGDDEGGGTPFSALVETLIWHGIAVHAKAKAAAKTDSKAHGDAP